MVRDRNDLFKKLFSIADEYIELRAILGSKIQGRDFISLNTDWEKIKKEVDQFCKDNEKQHIIFGIASRDGSGGAKENVVSISCVWAEMDYKDAPEAKIQEILNVFPLKPTIITNSGGGLHLYFKLDKPVGLERSADVVKMNDWIRLELNKLGKCKFDKISDIPKTLRLPGTVNHKYDNRPICKIVELNDNVYSLDDLLEMIPGSFEDSVIDTSDDDSLKELYNGSKEGSRNNNLTRLVGSWANDGLDFNECFQIACSVNSKNTPPLPDNEVKAIIRSILKKHNNEKAEVNNSEEWQNPIPFDDYSNLPEFPSKALPVIGREMVEIVSKVAQVDKGLPGSMYLAALSTCLSKKVQVDLGTHTEPVNIYTCPILDPGERKTSTMKLMMSPIYEYQKEMADQVIDDEELPVYIVDDITSEALFKVMSENNERLSVISAEGGIFGIMAGMYNSNGNGNIDVYLKGHAGDPCSNHRISRGPQSMDSPSLTICLTVQRNIIRDIGVNRQFRGRGLLARFLYCNCVHHAGNRKRQSLEIPDGIKDKYRKHILELMEMTLDFHSLKLTTDAQELWDGFYNDNETEMKLGGQMESIKDWGSKLPGAVARISGLLHFAEHGQQAVNKSISVGIVGDSVTIGQYFQKHALATFGLMGENPEIESAKKILDYLMLNQKSKFKGRDVLRNKSAFKTMGDVTPGIRLLVERNYIREVNSEPLTKNGRPEAMIYEVNPKVKIL